MPGKRPAYGRLFAGMAAVMCLIGIMTAAALAGVPTWRDVPKQLRKGPGVVREGAYLFVTATARIGEIREDKAFEIGRKKSLMRALQMAHMESSCEDVLAGFDVDERAQFIELFACLAPAVTIEGTTMLCQWEKESECFTSIAVPLASLNPDSCLFDSLSDAVSAYIERDVVSERGLEFCLRHSPQYSLLYRHIRERIDRYCRNGGSSLPVNAFSAGNAGSGLNQDLNELAMQNRLFRASLLTERAAKMAGRNQWDDARRLISAVFDSAPHYCRAYLLLARYLHEERNMPSLAMYAAEKAMRDGTCFREAVDLKRACLHALESPEAGIFDLLLSRCGSEKNAPYPKEWDTAMSLLNDTETPYLVLVSGGNAVEGTAMKPAAEYALAVEHFGKMRNSDDAREVLKALFAACETQPASPLTHNLIGACFRYREEPLTAIPFFLQALSLMPEYDYALVNLGLCCRQLGLMKSARFYFEQEAVRTSTSTWVRGCYAEFLEETR